MQLDLSSRADQARVGPNAPRARMHTQHTRAGRHDITVLLHAPWTSYLVSARTLEVPLFSEQETRLLLTEPLKHSSAWRDDDPARQRPRFEAGFWGEQGIERVHAEAGGWPHLM